MPKDLLKNVADMLRSSDGTLAADVAVAGFGVEFDGSDACAVLPAIALFLHQKV